MPQDTPVYGLTTPLFADLALAETNFETFALDIEALVIQVSSGYKVLPSRRSWDLEFERYIRGLPTTNYAAVFAAIFADADFEPGDEIVVRPGTYALTSSILVTQSCVIRGAGDRTKSIFDTSANIKIFDVSGTSNVIIKNLTVDGPTATAYNASSFGVYGESASTSVRAENVQIEGVVFKNIASNCIDLEFIDYIRVRDCYFDTYVRAGGMFQSCDYSWAQDNVLEAPTNGTGNPSGNTYYFAWTRNTNISISAQPRSKNFLCTGNTGFGGTWEGWDTHAGENGFIGYNFSYGNLQPIAIVGSADSVGDSMYAPKNVVAAYNYMDSGVTNGTFKPGIVIQGAGEITGTANDFAEGCKAIGNTIIGYGLENTSISCGLLIKYVKDTIIAENHFKECSPNGIVQDHTSYDTTIFGNTFLDTWTEQSVFVNAAICFPSPYGSAFVHGNRMSRGTKTVVTGFVNRTGIRIDDESPNPNAVVDIGFNSFFSATTPLWHLGVTKGRQVGDDASLITQGTLAVARGGTGITSYTTNNYIRASGATTLEQRTPAQVRTDIGADNAANLTTGVIPSARVNALNDVTTLAVSGATDLNGALTVDAGATFAAAQTVDHLGPTNFHDDVTLGTGAPIESSSFARFTRAASGDGTFATRVQLDAQDRYLVRADGSMVWGPGNAGADTILYRAGPNELKTDDNFYAAGDAMGSQESSSTTAQTVNVNAVDRYQTIGFTFKAPPSGVGEMITYADLQASLHVVYCTAFHEVRTGTTIGSGTIVDTGDNVTALGKSIAIQGGTTQAIRMSCSVSCRISGLTPGSDYNVVMRVRCGNTAGASVNCRAGRLSWYPR
jgi:hypothetical protein